LTGLRENVQKLQRAEGMIRKNDGVEKRSKNQVIASINAPGTLKCGDFFQRPDTTFGYEEYRRDHEDFRGWFPVGGFSQQVFATLKDAQIDAVRHIVWFAELKSSNLDSGPRPGNGGSTSK